jgi:hypothetical protein
MTRKEPKPSQTSGPNNLGLNDRALQPQRCRTTMRQGCGLKRTSVRRCATQTRSDQSGRRQPRRPASTARLLRHDGPHRGHDSCSPRLADTPETGQTDGCSNAWETFALARHFPFILLRHEPIAAGRSSRQPHQATRGRPDSPLSTGTQGVEHRCRCPPPQRAGHRGGRHGATGHHYVRVH